MNEQKAFMIKNIQQGNTGLGNNRNYFQDWQQLQVRLLPENNKFIKHRTLPCISWVQQVPLVQYNPEGLYFPALQYTNLHSKRI